MKFDRNKLAKCDNYVDKHREVINLDELEQGISSVTKIMTTIVASIAGISLLVGGIGVMNIMLVSVTERTREIGIRKSVGATRKQILYQFLIESMILTLLGGGIGTVLGYIGVFVIAYITGWPLLVTMPVIISGVLFSMLIGIVFGILPADKASKVAPITALRYE